MKRFIVCGSRDWTDAEAIHEALGQISDSAILVHGACPTGADAMAAAEWEGAGLKTEAHPADWKKHGRTAGPIRNQRMADLGADLCLAFHKGNSRGTADMIRRAEAAGIPVRVVRGGG